MREIVSLEIGRFEQSWLALVIPTLVIPFTSSLPCSSIHFKTLQALLTSFQENTRVLENLAVFQENLATKEDLELVKEEIQNLNNKLEQQAERRLFLGLDSKCQNILNKLAEGALTRSELALFLGVSDTSPLTQIRKLLAAGLIEEESILSGKRGRPKKKYVLVKK